MIPAQVGVIGGGRMGAGIAHAFACAGAHVAVIERDDEMVDAAAERIRDLIGRSAERGTLQRDRAAVEASVTVTTDADALSSVALVVEAVPEDRVMKAAAFARAEAVIGDDAVLASNTSSISIDALAETVRHPERFVGMHFFNPVPSSSLVEVVTGAATDPAVTARVREWVEGIGKTAIVVRDAPGFASSRLGVALGLEAIRMVEEGVASPADIDAAMQLGYRHPMGPLRTTDIVGLDVRLGIAEELHAQLGERFAPPELLRRMVAEGRLGRKSGRGFYEWSEG
ncbi:3-hydroxyacyl-CoA dehydrogenase family protein [Microbacterium terrisoli]|uniref:3-hydroxyacyl-CoA dehydrogenase family protein n=1 Tax=Microbacterium terrisoli TaxID=3242192 RepID=UPI00280426A6|nr:3-hydroxyacyl-CoA dehydrogenase family protein [Microbacterium protaetiae]